MRRARKRPRRTLADFAALLSPAATQDLRGPRRGRARRPCAAEQDHPSVLAALSGSNECVSTCTYCAASRPPARSPAERCPSTKPRRGRRSPGPGFRHLLLISGEHAPHREQGLPRRLRRALAADVPSLAVEVRCGTRRIAAWSRPGARDWSSTRRRTAATYERSAPEGEEAQRYDWRLAAADRARRGDASSSGLLGLHSDWRSEAVAMAVHARALIHRWWRCRCRCRSPGCARRRRLPRP